MCKKVKRHEFSRSMWFWYVLVSSKPSSLEYIDQKQLYKKSFTPNSPHTHRNFSENEVVTLIVVTLKILENIILIERENLNFLYSETSQLILGVCLHAWEIEEKQTYINWTKQTCTWKIIRKEQGVNLQTFIWILITCILIWPLVDQHTHISNLLQ